MIVVNNQPVSKSDYVRMLVKEEKFKEALRYAKEFRLGISHEDKESMRAAYECIVNPRFYLSIGKNPSEIAQKGVETVKRLYGNKNHIS